MSCGSAFIASSMSSRRGSDRVATVPGMARSQFATVHAAARYDLSIDTTSSGPEQAVTELMRFLT